MIACSRHTCDKLLHDLVATLIDAGHYHDGRECARQRI